MFSQEQHIIASLAQGRQAKLNYIQSMKKVLPKIIVSNGLDNVPIGGRNKPHVDAQFLGAPYAREASVLEKAQQLGLKRLAHVRTVHFRAASPESRRN